MNRSPLRMLLPVVLAGSAALAAIGLTPEITGVTPFPAAPSPSAQTLTVSGRNFVDHLTLAVTVPNGTVVTYREPAITDIRSGSFRLSGVLAETGVYKLVVTNPDGRGSNTYSLAVKAASASPSISDVLPADLFKSMSPQTITVNGAKFAAGMTVTVTDPAGGVQTLAGPAITKLTPNAFQLTVALEMAGDYSMIITLGDGSVSNSLGFKVRDH